MTGLPRPRFSIVTAVYDVEPYLPEFIESIEAQRIAPDELEVVAVDDGSTDGSLDLLTTWARVSRFRVKVFTKPNGGQGSARNLGLEHATGEWVTFSDPDDRLEQDFLHVAAAYARAHPALQVMAGKPIIHLEASDRIEDSHPRRHQYRGGNRLADMEKEPSVFPGSTNVTFYRMEQVRRIGLRFDANVRPNFEDGQFTVRYLLSLDKLEVGLLRDAIYFYRKRADQSSTLQRSLRDVRRYTTVLEHGYLAVLAEARARHGTIPAWLQHVLIYELYWYLSEDMKISSGAYIQPEVAPRFHELLQQILVQLDPEVVHSHTVLNLDPILRDTFARAGRPGSWHSDFVVHTRTDDVMGLRRLSYRFTGGQPSEEVEADGQAIHVAFAKTMAHRFYGRDLLFERILWVVDRPDLVVRLANVPVPTLRRWPGMRVPRRRRGRAGRWARGARRLLRQPPADILSWLRRRGRRIVRRSRGRLVRLVADRGPFKARFAGAWLLMDRIHDADDNGERLFEYVRKARPDINAWFVIERGTPDWRRLRARGERRLLAHGSFMWKMAMLNCSWLLSSHADVAVYRPPHLSHTGPATWKFAFVEHGIIKDDLSVWLNRRDLDMFVVSTEAELESVAGDGTAYRFTHKETRNTGLPRFDRLLEKGQAVPPEKRDLVIVAPTWRQWLARSLSGATSQRRILDAAFWDSDYIRNWISVLRSDRIADALAARGWRLGFMPHPNLQSMLPEMDLPPHVLPLSFAATDVQALYARCALLVTDYSSVAFNTAYIDRPLVYFQFDREQMLGGAHVGREGYFDYYRDGFGPVVLDVEAAIDAIVESIERGPMPAPEYQQRIDETFPVRDGGACARVVAVIEELSRPWQAPSKPGASAEPASGGTAANAALPNQPA